MKKGKIAAIVIGSVAAFVLLAVLVVGTVSHFLTSRFPEISIGITSEKYPDSDKYSVGNASVSENINRAEIYWKSGGITVEAYDGETVEISETGAESDSDRMRYLVSDGKLIIHHSKSGVTAGMLKNNEKSLTVKIPQNMASSLTELRIDSASSSVELSGITLTKKLDIDNVSGEIKLNNITAQTLDIDTASGSVTADGITVDVLKADTVSGDISANGAIRRIESDSASGAVNITTSVLLESAECDSVSGNITLTIPEGNGFTAELDTVSGKFNCDLPVIMRGDKRIHGDGSAEFEFDTTSADVTVKC